MPSWDPFDSHITMAGYKQNVDVHMLRLNAARWHVNVFDSVTNRSETA